MSRNERQAVGSGCHSLILQTLRVVLEARKSENHKGYRVAQCVATGSTYSTSYCQVVACRKPSLLNVDIQ